MLFHEQFMTSRRQFLNTTLHAGSALALNSLFAATCRAAEPPAVIASALRWRDLGDGLGLVQGAGGNVLVLQGSDGVALVDGGNAQNADALLSAIRSKTFSDPSLLFNTHCHRAQIGCNAILGAQGATIVAHENTRLWLTTEILSKWENEVYAPLPTAALPNKTFYYDSETLQFNEQITYGYLPQGHTDGDIYVHLPARNVLFAGDVVSVGAYPIVDYATNGWIGGMINSLNLLLTLCDDYTRVIASSGDVVNKAHIQSQLELCSALADRIGTHYYKGLSLAEFIASKPTAEFDAAWGNPDLFILTAYEGTLPHVTEIRRFGRANAR